MHIQFVLLSGLDQGTHKNMHARFSHDTNLGGIVNIADDRIELQNYSKQGNWNQENRMKCTWAV